MLIQLRGIVDVAAAGASVALGATVELPRVGLEFNALSLRRVSLLYIGGVAGVDNEITFFVQPELKNDANAYQSNGNQLIHISCYHDGFVDHDEFVDVNRWVALPEAKIRIGHKNDNGFTGKLIVSVYLEETKVSDADIIRMNRNLGWRL